MFQHRSSDGRQSGEKGFTLVELLVVIVILGILAGVVVFAVSGISDRGTTSACATDKRTIETAIEAYRANNTANATPNMALLVSSGLLGAASGYHTLAYSGTTPVLTAISSCA